MRDPSRDAGLTATRSERLDVPDHQGAILRATKLLWHQRRFLMRACLAGLVIGTLIAFLTPRRYQSTTRLMPPDSQLGGPLGMMASIAANSNLSQIATDLMPMKSTGALFLGILRSRTLEDRIVDRFDLRKVYGKKLMIDARHQLEDNTMISEDRRGGIISVTVTDRDPRRAAAIARTYVEELDRLVVELNTSAAHRERVFIEEQLTQVKRDLDEASRKLSEFSSKNATIDVKEQAKAMVEAGATLQGQLIAAEAELKGLEQIYSNENVRVRSANARVSELRAQLRELSGTPEHASADHVQPDPSYPSLRELPILGLTYADLYRTATIQETVYETLVKQYEVAKVEEAKEIPSVRVLDVADIPERKSGPFRLAIISVSTFLSLCLAMGGVLGYSKWKSVDADDPARVFLEGVAKQIKLGTNGSRFHRASEPGPPDAEPEAEEKGAAAGK